MMELRERFIKTNGVKLHVMEAGPEDGPMLLLLHVFLNSGMHGEGRLVFCRTRLPSSPGSAWL